MSVHMPYKNNLTGIKQLNNIRHFQRLSFMSNLSIKTASKLAFLIEFEQVSTNYALLFFYILGN